MAKKPTAEITSGLPMTDLVLLRQAAEKAQLTDLVWTGGDPTLAMIENGVLPNTAKYISLVDPQTVVSLLDRLENEREGRKVAEVSLRLALSRLVAVEKVVDAARQGLASIDKRGASMAVSQRVELRKSLRAYDALSNSGTTNTTDASSSVVVDPSEEGESE